MKKCNLCGTEVDPRATVCPICGQTLEPSAPEGTSSKAAPTQEVSLKCELCGQALTKDLRYCPVCGQENPHYQGEEQKTYAPQPQQQSGNQYYSQTSRQSKTSNNEDSGSIGFGILSFFIPLVGIILYFVWKNDRPKAAKSCLIGAASAFILAILSNVLLGLLGGL